MMIKRGLLKEYANIWSALLQTVDMFALLLSGLAAGKWYLPVDQVWSQNYLQILLLALLLAAVVFNRFGFYSAWRNNSLISEIKVVTIGWAIVIMVLALFLFVSKSGGELPLGWAVLWFILSLIGFLGLRLVLRQLLRWLRRKGYNQRRILIVGQDTLMDDLAERLSRATWMGLLVVGQETLVAVENVDRAVLESKIKSLRIDQVWIALPLKEELLAKAVIASLSASSVEIRYVPDLFGFRLFSHSVSEVAGLQVITLSSSPMTSFDRLIKAFEDRSLALVILVLMSPLMLVLAAGVKLSSPGPVFFRQLRKGWDDKPICVLKFRSMFLHQEAEGVLTQASKKDLRFTRLGAFIRRTSLDELPQFWNVLLGDMSIVGPRPHAILHHDKFKALVDGYMLRHRVKPGITGWAQINGYRGETDTLEKMRCRVEHDLYYIQHWSLFLDLKIIILTVCRGFVGKNAY